MTISSDPLRKSPIYHRLGTTALAADLRNGAGAGAAGDPPRPGRLSLFDFSTAPRWGLKGRGAFAWLSAHGATVPEQEQTATRQLDGALIGRLSPGEALVLSSRDGICGLGNRIDQIPESGELNCYPAPRRDSHALFVAHGDEAPKMLAKLCAVDLSFDRFAIGQIAQTSVARVSSIVIRNDVDNIIGYSILTETSSAEYLWDCLLDAMNEFGGAIGRASVPIP